MPYLNTGVQYSGIWTLQQVDAAIAAGTWPVTSLQLWSWGNNEFGKLGLGNNTNYSSPKQVGSLTGWLQVSAGGYQGAVTAVKQDGTLWSWGYNQNGQLGLGNRTRYSSPKQVGALTIWLQTSAGEYHTAAVTTAGTLWTWGRNANGQLGLGNTTNYSSPVQVGSLTNWLAVSCGGHSTCATKTDGTLWAWGKNDYGQLGQGNTTYRSSPVQIGALTTWAAVQVGTSTAIAVKTDGTLWGWGRANNYGQLGLGSNTNYSSPKQIGLLTNWTANFFVDEYAVAVKTDGTLWGWGRNSNGNLGLGNITQYNSPVQIGALTNWQSSHSSGEATAAIKTNGTLWTWGSNFYGELGLGSNGISYSSPKQVGSLTTWKNASICGGVNRTFLALKQP